MTSATTLARPLALGLSTGGRTFTAAAVLALRSPTTTRPVRRVLPALAVAELVADKLPQAPSRLEPVGVAARAVFGAGSAVAHARRRRSPVGPAIVIGVAGAAAGAWAGHWWRGHADDLGVPAIAAALAEDIVVVALAAVGCRR
jgi:uncharacterized membrane protein